MRNPEIYTPEQGHTIRLSEDREVIANKLEEYKKRFDQFMAPELQFDTIYKIEIAQALVNDGEVDTSSLAIELESKYGNLDSELYANACRVISDYIKTGGKFVRGGTGLFTDKSMDTPEEPERMH